MNIKARFAYMLVQYLSDLEKDSLAPHTIQEVTNLIIRFVNENNLDLRNKS